MSEDDHACINHQIGALESGVDYMKERIDKIVTTLEKQQADLDEIKLQMAEIRGAKKFTEWIRSIIAGLIGAVASAVSLLVTLGWWKP